MFKTKRDDISVNINSESARYGWRGAIYAKELWVPQYSSGLQKISRSERIFLDEAFGVAFALCAGYFDQDYSVVDIAGEEVHILHSGNIELYLRDERKRQVVVPLRTADNADKDYSGFLEDARINLLKRLGKNKHKVILVHASGKSNSYWTKVRGYRPIGEVEKGFSEDKIIAYLSKTFASEPGLQRSLLIKTIS